MYICISTALFLPRVYTPPGRVLVCTYAFDPSKNQPTPRLTHPIPSHHAKRKTQHPTPTSSPHSAPLPPARSPLPRPKWGPAEPHREPAHLSDCQAGVRIFIDAPRMSTMTCWVRRRTRFEGGSGRNRSGGWVHTGVGRRWSGRILELEFEE